MILFIVSSLFARTSPADIRPDCSKRFRDRQRNIRNEEYHSLWREIRRQTASHIARPRPADYENIILHAELSSA
ncbi:MAG: hypothetical protein ABTQ30_08520 [Rhizobiaceae bacterium]